VVIDKGQVIEQGTHHDLMAKSKVYKKLIEIQKIGEE
jgi:ABC-type multidrug transport system fused ATPase/permease subunit